MILLVAGGENSIQRRDFHNQFPEKKSPTLPLDGVFSANQIPWMDIKKPGRKHPGFFFKEFKLLQSQFCFYKWGHVCAFISIKDNAHTRTAIEDVGITVFFGHCINSCFYLFEDWR